MPKTLIAYKIIEVDCSGLSIIASASSISNNGSTATTTTINTTAGIPEPTAETLLIDNSNSFNCNSL